MKTFQTWMVSAVFLLSVLGLTACGNNDNRNATTTENAADKTKSSYYVNGATDTTNRGDDGILNDAMDDIGEAGNGVIDGVGDAGRGVIDGVGDAGKAVIDGIGDAGRAVIDGAEDLGDTLTDDRDVPDDDDLDDEILDDDRDDVVDLP